MKKWDVAIIGSGISSLTAGAILSKKGKSVCVLEQHTKPGGYLHCFSRFGIPFETGSHYVGSMDPGQPFHTLLRYLGVFDDSLFIPLDPDGFDQFRFPSIQFDFPKGHGEVVRRLSHLFPDEKDGIANYFRLIQDTVAQFPSYSFDTAYDDVAMLRSLETPVRSVVESQVHNSHLRAILYGHSTISGVRPEHMPFGLHALITDSMITGPHGFKAGGDALTQRFVKVIEDNGGKLFLKAHVEKLLTNEKREVTAALLSNGVKIEADWFISGAHPKTTFSWLDQTQMKPAFKTRLQKMEESVAFFGVYGYSRTVPDLNPLKNYYLFHSENPEEYLSSGSVHSIPKTVFVTRTHREEKLKDKFPVTFHSAAPIEWFGHFDGTRYNERPKHYFELKEKIATNLFKSVDTFLPGLSPSLEKYETSTALSNIHFNGSPGGSAYGVYHSIENTGIRAIGPRTHFPNLLLTGQSTLCPGLLGSAISGLRTSGHLIGIKPILEELNTFRGQA